MIVPAVHPPAVFDGVEFVSDPAAAYLNKPIEDAKLLETVTSYLGDK